MTLLRQLIKEISSERIWITCPSCNGDGVKQSDTYQNFVKKYCGGTEEGCDALKKFNEAEELVFKKDSKYFSRTQDEQARLLQHFGGLSYDEASDFVAVILDDDVTLCEKCNGKNLILSEYGKDLLSLIKVLDEVFKASDEHS